MDRGTNACDGGSAMKAIKGLVKVVAKEMKIQNIIVQESK
jgi:hypothetical protein